MSESLPLDAQLTSEQLKSALSAAIQDPSNPSASRPTALEQALLNSKLSQPWEQGLAAFAIGFRATGTAVTSCQSVGNTTAYKLALIGADNAPNYATVRKTQLERAASEGLFGGKAAEQRDVSNSSGDQVLKREPAVQEIVASGVFTEVTSSARRPDRFGDPKAAYEALINSVKPQGT